MTKEQVIKKLRRALARLTKNDSFIVTENVNERSMTHMLAMYLAEEFPEYHVDCEYNRMAGENGEQVKKQIYGTPNPDLVSIDDINAQTIFPDIVIHRRENGDNNLLIIEAKKSGGNTRVDYEKLNTYVQGRNNGGLGYNFSAFVIFNTENPEGSNFEVKNSDEHWE